jgi:hypothetical protein
VYDEIRKQHSCLCVREVSSEAADDIAHFGPIFRLCTTTRSSNQKKSSSTHSTTGRSRSTKILRSLILIGPPAHDVVRPPLPRRIVPFKRAVDDLVLESWMMSILITGARRDLDHLEGPRSVPFSGLRFRVDQQNQFVSWMGWEMYLGFSRDMVSVLCSAL